VFDRLLGRLIEECESFGLATTMVIPSGLALDVQGAAFREKLSIQAWPCVCRKPRPFDLMRESLNVGEWSR
jgi:hypothetical protein